MGNYVYLDCPECKTEKAKMRKKLGPVTELVCKECGERWAAPQREVARNQVPDEEFE